MLHLLRNAGLTLDPLRRESAYIAKLAEARGYCLQTRRDMLSLIYHSDMAPAGGHQKNAGGHNAPEVTGGAWYSVKIETVISMSAAGSLARRAVGKTAHRATWAYCAGSH